jgi:hypothetical protein
MHRQAMLVSLSLSPASTAAKNDKHWAFLVRSQDLNTPLYLLTFPTYSLHPVQCRVSLCLRPAMLIVNTLFVIQEEIDAPQWADLKAEEALAKAGTIG